MMLRNFTLPFLLFAALAVPFAGTEAADFTDAPDSILTATIPAAAVPPNASEGDWVLLQGENLPTHPRSHAQAVFVPTRDGVIVFGGKNGNTVLKDVWELKLRPVPAWQQLQPQGTGPTPRWGHSAIYDPIRNRLLVYGGALATFGNATGQIWELTLDSNPAWHLLPAGGTPPPTRYGHRAIYDPSRDRMIVFGGFHNNHLNDVWQLTLSPTLQWTQIVASGAAAPPREGAIAVYDSSFDRMVLYGGKNATISFGDMWILTFSGQLHWQQVPSGGSSPAARSYAAEVADPTRGGVWIFGGFDGAGIGSQDVWLLTLGATPTWSELAVEGAGPAKCGAATNAYDSVGDRLLITGGSDPPSDQVWTVSPVTATWGALFPMPGLPKARWGHSAFLDPVADRVMIFGGAAEGGTDPARFNDTWGFEPSSIWGQFIPSGAAPPPPRYVHTTVYDSKRRRAVIFGGFDGAFENDVWSLTLDPLSWTPMSPQGTLPIKRDGAGAIYDPVGDRMVLFGGWNNSAQLRDVWTLSLEDPPQWTLHTPTYFPGTIPSRSAFGAAYDPFRRLMWIAYGLIADARGIDDVWMLSLDEPMAWTRIEPAGTRPSARWGVSLVYDAYRDRLLLFGGADPEAWFNEIWELTLSGTPTWRRITPAGTPPGARLQAGVVWDPIRDWLIVYGGTGPKTYADVWAWRIADQPTPTQAAWIESRETAAGLELLWSAPSGTVADIERRAGASDWARISTQVADESQRVLYVDGSIGHGTRYGYRLRLGDETYGEAWVQTSSHALQLAGLSSNPGTRSSKIGFTLPGSGAGRLEMIDLRGRVVFTREVGSMGAGPHAVGFSGAAIHPGVYWIRLTQGAETRTAKAVLF